MAMVKPAQATATTVAPAKSYCVYYYAASGCGFTSPLQACQALWGSGGAVNILPPGTGVFAYCIRPDGMQDGFVLSYSSCPANSTGMPAANPTTCTCNTGFRPDPAQTSCVPDQYTIALAGLGGIVMPTRTRDAYAQVSKSNGSPKSGVQVDLLYIVKPENDAPLRAEYIGSV